MSGPIAAEIRRSSPTRLLYGTLVAFAISFIAYVTVFKIG